MAATRSSRRKLDPIGKIIRKRMIDLDMTQRTFAALIGSNYNYVTNIMYGDRPGTKYIDKIAEVLNLDKEMLKKIA